MDGTCEGLGPTLHRTFLHGHAADWRSGPGIDAPATVVWAPKAAIAARKLGPGRARPDGEVSTPGVWLRVDGRDDPERSFSAEEREIPGIGPDGGAFRVADAWVFDVDHWARLLWANLRAIGPFLWQELVGSPAWLGVKGAIYGVFGRDAVAAAFVRRGARTRVHRHATVEASWLGDGVTIGAGAVVRGAVIGDGAVVEELAVVEGTVLGAGAKVQRQALAKYSVIEDGAAVAGIVQLGVVGRGAQVKHGAILMDMSLGQGVRVKRRGVLEDAPYGMLGVCVGPGAVVAQGVRIAPGRVVPAGLTILSDPAQVLRDLAVPEGCTRATVRDGRLEALR